MLAVYTWLMGRGYARAFRSSALTAQARPLGKSMKINVWKEDICCSREYKKSTIRSFTLLTIH